MAPKVLITDIECMPALAWTFELFRTTIGIGQIKEHPYVHGVGWMWDTDSSAKWLEGDRAISKAWKLLDEATHVVTWNGRSFDGPWLNTEFLRQGSLKPSPYRHVDLMLWVKKNARFMSNKLDYVAGELLDQHKLDHEGFALWRKVMEGDPAARRRMARYCKQDVMITRNLYFALLPWLDGLGFNLYSDDMDGCPGGCGSEHLVKEGFAYTVQGKFQRYHCRSCGRWSRDTKRLDGVTIVEVK